MSRSEDGQEWGLNMQPTAIPPPSPPPPRSILSGKLGGHTEASLSKPWLSPRLAAPELPPPFPDKTLDYEQRAHRQEERAWSHPRNSMLAELARADQEGWP